MQVFSSEGIQINESTVFYNNTAYYDTPMSEFDDSFNIILGTTNKTFDWFNNPFVIPNVYEVNENNDIKLSKEIKMKQCTLEDKKKLLTDTTINYYPNSICFEDKSKIKLKNDWYNKEYKNLYLTIDACNQR